MKLPQAVPRWPIATHTPPYRLRGSRDADPRGFVACRAFRVASMLSRGFGIELVTFDFLSHNSVLYLSHNSLRILLDKSGLRRSDSFVFIGINGLRRVNAEAIIRPLTVETEVPVPQGAPNFLEFFIED